MIPERLSYTRNHQWCFIDGKMATVGVTPHAIKSLGHLVCIEFPDEGDDVLHDVPFGEIEGTRDVKDLFSPIDGIAAEINGRVAHDPDILLTDPFDEGWLIRIKLLPNGRRAEMLSAAQYRQYVGKRR